MLLLAGFGVGYFIYIGQYEPENAFAKFPFKYGLDIQGGTELVYQADTSTVSASEIGQTMDALRDVIERRVNLFGVSEPVVQTEVANSLSGAPLQRLIVELPGVTDTQKAVELIGQTPLLEFKTERPDGSEKTAIQDAYTRAQDILKNPDLTDELRNAVLASDPLLSQDPAYVLTDLNGSKLQKASLIFDSRTNEPKVLLTFTDEGRKMFADITRANVDKTVAIYLDGAPISTPVVREAILDGNAEISGSFNILEARELVGRLNSGALPVPISLLSTQTIGATLGESALHSGVKAGLVGIIIVAFFLFIWYRIPGLVATVALSIYIAIMLAIFKLIPVTLTAAGIAGFILSIGMAVDANILIFERMKEELKKGKDLSDAMHDGFARAWLSIRDSNISSMLSAIILFWFGTSLVKGFALTLGIGVVVSMFSAITVTRTFLFALGTHGHGKVVKFLFGNGIR
ncbi:MAG: Preprotein translocase subunit SecD [Parcubacteria group bacterium GW2011_GWA2_47_8]|nr:MAG: Preprotein translocase subunit SecD [Parcubacteria group bacterium GW2011_GWA2_47_8]